MVTMVQQPVSFIVLKQANLKEIEDTSLDILPRPTLNEYPHPSEGRITPKWQSSQ